MAATYVLNSSHRRLFTDLVFVRLLYPMQTSFSRVFKCSSIWKLMSPSCFKLTRIMSSLFSDKKILATDGRDRSLSDSRCLPSVAKWARPKFERSRSARTTSALGRTPSTSNGRARPEPEWPRSSLTRGYGPTHWGLAHVLLTKSGNGLRLGLALLLLCYWCGIAWATRLKPGIGDRRSGQLDSGLVHMLQVNYGLGPFRLRSGPKVTVGSAQTRIWPIRYWCKQV